MPSKSYRVKIARSGDEFEAEGDRAFVLDMLRRFAFLAGPTGKKGGGVAKLRAQDTARDVPLPEQSAQKAVSPREFVHQLNLKKHTDITLAFGYYLEKFRGNAQFSAADINNCYYEAKMESSNTSQMIAQNLKRRFMMYAKGGPKSKRKNSYTVTRSGEAFIESKIHSAA